jgi:hypothetical protein
MPHTPPPPDRIVILDPDDLHYARMTDPGAFNDASTVITSPADAAAVIPAPYRHAVLPLVEPGVILLRNPLAAGVEFVREAQAHEELSVAKFVAFIVVCQALHARKVDIDDERVAHHGAEWRVGADASAGPLASLKGEANFENVQRILQRVKVIADFEPQTRSFKRADADKARAAARERGIGHDSVIAGLIDMRANIDNPLTKYEMTLDITADASRALNSTLSLAAILRKITPNLAAKLDRLKAGNDHMTLKVIVHF